MRPRWLLTTILSLLVVSLPAKSAQLLDWRFDPQRHQLHFQTDTDTQPSVQLIFNPTRLVIDLPGVSLNQPKLNQAIGGEFTSVRIAQFNPETTRVVIELAAGYSLDPSNIKIQSQSPTDWTIQLPPAQSASLTSQSSPPVVIPLPSYPVATRSAPAISRAGFTAPGQSLSWLQQRLDTYRASYPAFRSGMFFLDMDNGNYVDLNGSQVFPAASIIKLPILIAFFQDVDAGKVRLDETLTMRPELIASGSGEMQFLPPWSRFGILQTFTQMIIISDNTATNMIIKRLGGPTVLNQRFRSWGLTSTTIRNWLPDLQGTNTTTPKELVSVLVQLEQGKLLSPQSQEQALGILRRTKNRKLLAAGLGPGATIAHKTGDIGFMLGDAGMIEMPGGKRYMAAIIAKTPYDDRKGWDFMREISRMVYTYFSQSQTSSNPNDLNSIIP